MRPTFFSKTCILCKTAKRQLEKSNELKKTEKKLTCFFLFFQKSLTSNEETEKMILKLFEFIEQLMMDSFAKINPI